MKPSDESRFQVRQGDKLPPKPIGSMKYGKVVPSGQPMQTRVTPTGIAVVTLSSPTLSTLVEGEPSSVDPSSAYATLARVQGSMSEEFLEEYRAALESQILGAGRPLIDSSGHEIRSSPRARIFQGANVDRHLYSQMFSLLGEQGISPNNERITTLDGTCPWELTYLPGGVCEVKSFIPKSKGLHVAPGPELRAKYFSV